MTFTWERLNANLGTPGFMLQSFVRAFGAGPDVFLIGVYGNVTSVAMLESKTMKLRFPPDKLILGEPCKEVIAMSQTIYAIDVSDNLYRLTHCVPEQCRDDCRDKYYWKRLPGLKNVKAITGSQFGITVIEYSKESSHLTTYDVRDEPLPMIFASLGSSDGEFYITSFSAAALDSNLAQPLLGERYMAAVDVIIFSTPSGWVYILPLISECQEVKPIEIHFERYHTLSAAAVTGDGKTIVLAYKLGKIVLIYVDDGTKLQTCRSFFTSTNFKTVILTGSSENILIISSDYSAIQLTTISDRCTLKVRLIDATLAGVRYLAFIKESRQFLAFSCFGYVFKFAVDSFECEVVRSPSKVLDDINTVGAKNDILLKDLEEVNNALYSIENEQFESFVFQLVLDGMTVELTNESPRVFKKDHWTIQVEGTCNDEFFVKIVPLDKDFEAGSAIKIDVAHFIDNHCNSLKLSLLCSIAEDLRNMIVELGSLELCDSDNMDVDHIICQKLKEILVKQKCL